MYTVYVLQSTTHTYLYVGLTHNLLKRVKQHQDGREKTTRPYRPFRLVYEEHVPSRARARTREKYLKSGCGKEWWKGGMAQSDIAASRRAAHHCKRG